MGSPSPPLQPLPDHARHAELEGLVDMEPSAPAKLCTVDVETSGLEVDQHEIWELAVINGETEYHQFLQIDLAKASPDALRMNGYYERHPAVVSPESWRAPNPRAVAAEVARLTAGGHLVGINPAFDATFLGAFLRRCSAAPAWHYHLVDVLPLAAGRLGVRPPWQSKDLSHMLGVRPPQEGDRHTALGDARWAWAMYDAAFQPKET